jgi:hypothetical protein
VEKQREFEVGSDDIHEISKEGKTYIWGLKQNG